MLKLMWKTNGRWEEYVVCHENKFMVERMAFDMAHCVRDAYSVGVEIWEKCPRGGWVKIGGLGA